MKTSASVLLRLFAAILFAASLSGCASMMGLDNDPARVAEAPDYRVGDRWIYHVEDGYRLPTIWQETHEITDISEQGITVHVARKGEHIDDARTEIWPRPGLVAQGSLMSSETRYFNPPFERFRFPMHAGDSWGARLKVDVGNQRSGSPDFRVNVLGWERMASPVGETDALMMFVFTLFDDEEFWRWPARGTYKVWYAPAVNNVLYAERHASFIEKVEARAAIEIPVQHETVRLISYTRGQ